MRIGIVGADSFHVPVYAQSLIKRGHEVIVYIDRMSQKLISTNRIKDIIERLNAISTLTLTDTFEDLLECEAFLILSVDASTHRHHCEKLAHLNHPIYIDKPLTYMSDEENLFLALSQKIPLFSASCLRFSKVVQEVKRDITSRDIKHIEIKGPLAFVEDVPLMHWYGIHLFEILNELISDEITISNLTLNERELRFTGTCDGVKISIIGDQYQRMPYQVIVDNHPYQLENLSDVYERLVDTIEYFFQTNASPVSIMNSFIVLKLLETIERELNHES